MWTIYVDIGFKLSYQEFKIFGLHSDSLSSFDASVTQQNVE